MNNSFTFIDLFAGIGAFHLALEKLGGKCVFASEIDKYAIETYEENFNMSSDCNIFDVKAEDIPKHDILCAGFPCQPFSNAGHKKGFVDTRGTLFFEIERILKHHKTKYIILENVKHLVNHDDGNTFRVIKEHLNDLGYVLTKDPLIVSPHHIGVPQNRERIFIVGIHRDYYEGEYIEIDVPNKESYPITSVFSVLDRHIDNYSEYAISEYEGDVLRAWDALIKHFRKHNKKVISPILIDEFGQDYDYTDLPKWKQDYCQKNREFYLNNKEYLDAWMQLFEVNKFKKRDRKLEWQAGDTADSVYGTLIQLRQSGIRCKRTSTFPALVAIVQTSIVGKYLRRITPREAARLQSFPENYILNKNEHMAYKQLGNSANVDVIVYIAEQLLKIKLKGADNNEQM